MSDFASVCPGSANTYSKAPAAYPANAPRRAVRSYGPYVECDDGRRYVDCVSALGAVMLGHCHQVVEWAARRQMMNGVSVSLPTAAEAELSYRLVDLIPGAEMVRLGKNGNDVTNAAVRIARAATGRHLVLRNGYHGHADWCVEAPKAGGVLPGNVEARARLRYQELERLSAAGSRVAAVVLDPRPAEDPRDPSTEYFAEVRRLCDHYGTILVYDEMVTGFRTGWPGHVGASGVIPDLWCGAKALGNGFPITALAGRADLMRRIEQDVFYSTTFAGEAVSIAAAIACLDEMRRVDATAQVQALGREIRAAYEVAAMELGLAAETWVDGYDARPIFRWRDPEDRRVFLEGCVEGGLLIQGYVNVMVAHAECMFAIKAGLAAGLMAVAGRHAEVAA